MFARLVVFFLLAAPRRIASSLQLFFCRVSTRLADLAAAAFLFLNAAGLQIEVTCHAFSDGNRGANFAFASMTMAHDVYKR